MEGDNTTAIEQRCCGMEKIALKASLKVRSYTDIRLSKHIPRKLYCTAKSCLPVINVLLFLVIIVKAPKKKQLVSICNHPVPRSGWGSLLGLQLLPFVTVQVKPPEVSIMPEFLLQNGVYSRLSCGKMLLSSAYRSNVARFQLEHPSVFSWSWRSDSVTLCYITSDVLLLMLIKSVSAATCSELD